jgi:hypothetical protein
MVARRLQFRRVLAILSAVGRPTWCTRVLQRHAELPDSARASGLDDLGSRPLPQDNGSSREFVVQAQKMVKLKWPPSQI